MYEIFDKLMKERGLTPYRVSKETGISQGSLSDWKSGRSKLGADKLLKLADYFGVTVDYLMGREQKEKPATENGNGLGIGPAYLSLAKDMQEGGIHPDDVRAIMDVLKRRNNDK